MGELPVVPVGAVGLAGYLGLEAYLQHRREQHHTSLVAELSAEERLLRAIFNEKSREVRDTSLKVPHGEEGTIIGVKVFDAQDGDDELETLTLGAASAARRSALRARRAVTPRRSQCSSALRWVSRRAS